ncbi:MAG: carboxylating nicotinate-nucleotide diphosphorylase [Actinomycetales bacterium]
MATDWADALRASGLVPQDVSWLIDRALAEDVDEQGDVTSIATMAPQAQGVMDLVARRPGVVAGVPVAAAVFTAVDPQLQVQINRNDGESVLPGEVILTISGRLQDLLRAERTALNLLCHLSGIATLTRAWVDAIAGTGARIRDTRKTTPGMRTLEKYAVRCGGGTNHRMSLSDAALIKDNHVVAAGGVVPAFTAVRQAFPGLPIEVEVDRLDQLAEILPVGADLVLLDNFTIPELRAAVAMNAGRARLEASGGLTLDRAREVAETGVDYLAVGALTHSAPVLDIGADVRTEVIVEEG